MLLDEALGQSSMLKALGIEQGVSWQLLPVILNMGLAAPLPATQSPDLAAADCGLSKKGKKLKKQVPFRVLLLIINIKHKFLGSGELVSLVSCQNRSGRLPTQRKLK